MTELEKTAAAQTPAVSAELEQRCAGMPSLLCSPSSYA